MAIHPMQMHESEFETHPSFGTSPLPRIDPSNTVFALLCFEGPDPYSMAGGLGVRVTELA